MEVRVVTKIQNTPENVWKILTDETLFSEWSGIQADTAELREGGFIWLKAKGNEPPTELFVTAFEEGKMITLSGPETDETYRLYPDEGGCMLEKSIIPKDGRNFEGEEYPKEVVRQQAFLDAFKSIAEKRNDPAKTVPVQKKIENPKQKEIKKRSHAKKWIILAAVLVILIGAGIASWFFLINPYLEENDRIRKYNSGAEAIEAGKYEEAKEIFTELGDYDNSKELLEYANKGITFEKAQKEMKKGDYKKAKELLEPLGTYKTSADLLKECEKNITFEDAQQKLEQKDYRKAREILISLGDFNNCKDLIKECDRAIAYEDGTALISEGKYAEAVEKLNEAGDYPGTKDAIALCTKEMNYQNIRVLVENGKYEEAIDLLCEDDAEEMPDREDLIMECENGIAYEDALALYRDEKYYSACKAFKNLGSYKDSEEYAARCIQTKPSTKETYHNSAYSGKSCSLKIQPPNDGTYTYFKIYAMSGGDEILVLSVFINKGSNITVNLPAGSYIFKAASGSGDWYGEKEMFGSSGVYSRLLSSDTSDIFRLESNHDYTLTLKTEGGNVGSESEYFDTF